MISPQHLLTQEELLAECAKRTLLERDLLARVRLVVADDQRMRPAGFHSEIMSKIRRECARARGYMGEADAPGGVLSTKVAK